MARYRKRSGGRRFQRRRTGRNRSVRAQRIGYRF